VPGPYVRLGSIRGRTVAQRVAISRRGSLRRMRLPQGHRGAIGAEVRRLHHSRRGHAAGDQDVVRVEGGGRLQQRPDEGRAQNTAPLPVQVPGPQVRWGDA
jgi:hypothetical protein